MGKHAARRRVPASPRLVVPVVALVLGLPTLAAAAKAGLDVRADEAASASTRMPVRTQHPGAGTPTAGSGAAPSPQRQQVVSSLPPLKPAPTRTPADRKAKATKADKRVEKETVPPLTFRVGSLNVLGASHTAGRNDRYADGATRMRWAAQILAGTGLSVVGLQEFQPSQYATLRSYAPGWGVWPGPALGRAPTANSIIWRADQWQLVESHTIAVPYFFGHLIPMPYVKLRNLATGREIWVGNVHNPADAHGNAARYRARAVAIEASLARQLSADGTPVVFTGDMNDRERYFCPMTASAPMHSASGGGSGTPCAPPAMPGVDWVMGSTPVSFSNYHRVTSGLITRVTDHGMVYADASLAGSN